MNAESLIAAWRPTGQVDLRPLRPDLPEAGCGLPAKGRGKAERLAVDWKRLLESAHGEAWIEGELRGLRTQKGSDLDITVLSI